MSVILEMRNITKRFGPVIANNDVSLSINEGEVHALLGENGAGKSTLMNILYGLYTQTEGEVLYKGEVVNIHDPRHAIDLGIGMVHQHFMLIPALSVVENVVLGYKGNKTVIDLKAAAKRLTELSEHYMMPIDPWERVENLSVGQQQRLEILKALYRDADLLILDEPTAVLTPQEVDGLREVLASLTKEGKTVIFITHKMAEIMTMCDRCTILRGGRVMAAGLPISEVQSVEDLAALMVGKDVVMVTDKTPAQPAEVVLEVTNLSYTDNRGIQRLKNISFQLHAGEILGICGVDGNGQSELIKAITGLIRDKEGTVEFMGEDVSREDARTFLMRGVGHIPEDRISMGMVPQMNLRENVALINFDQEHFSKGWLMDWNWIQDHTEKIIEVYDVKTPSTMVQAGNLSGGNQQKLVVGRELSRHPKLIIAVHPCRGLDIGSTKYIQGRLVEARDNGAAVLMVSTELFEILEIPDRIAVMYEGEFIGIVNQEDATTRKLGLMMAGLKPENDQAAARNNFPAAE